ncbi:MAG: TIGR02594 family protein, partial [Pseudomonadota bacterium]
GFDPGPMDGLRGRRTLRAVRRFQEAKGLVPDGSVGAETHRALFGTLLPGEVPQFDVHPWFDEALRLVGLTEDTGPGSNPTILKMARDLDLAYSDDDLPWCGLFVAHCVGTTLPDEPLPSNPLGARAWERVGVPVAPRRGAIMTFWRQTLKSGLGHAGFYYSETESDYMILGGNQLNMVNIVPVSKDRHVAARWPISGLLPDTGEEEAPLRSVNQ